MEQESFRVVIADDNVIMREGIASIVRQRQGFQVVGLAADGLEAVNLALKLKPDVVLMDLQMPLMNGVQATQKVLELLPATKVVALTTFSTPSYVSAALTAGVHGYLLKDSFPDEIEHAIKAACRGQAVITQRALEALNSVMGRPEPPAGASWGLLTEGEQRIVWAVCQGWSNREISSYFTVTESAVKALLTRAMRKVGVTSRLQLAVEAGRQNFPLDSKQW